MTYTVERIGTGKDEARDVVRIVGSDMEQTFGDPGIAKWTANPDDKIHVELQLRRIRMNPHMYHAVYQDQNMVGVLKMNDWLCHDQEPFDIAQPSFLGRAVQKVMHGRLPGRPQGIHTLAAYSKLDLFEQHEIIDHLVTFAAVSTSREIRIGLPLERDHDNNAIGSAAMRIVRNHDFVSTGEIGSVRVSPYVALFQSQELFVRPSTYDTHDTESALVEFERSLRV
jgi:hypothetical protein